MDWEKLYIFALVAQVLVYVFRCGVIYFIFSDCIHRSDLQFDNYSSSMLRSGYGLFCIGVFFVDVCILLGLCVTGIVWADSDSTFFGDVLSGVATGVFGWALFVGSAYLIMKRQRDYIDKKQIYSKILIRFEYAVCLYCVIRFFFYLIF